jgi:hypothetical protein
VEFSVRRPSPPNTYSYVRGENLGSTRKFIEIYLLFTCITNRVAYQFDTGSLAGIGIDTILVLVSWYFGWYFEH